MDNAIIAGLFALSMGLIEVIKAFASKAMEKRSNRNGTSASSKIEELLGEIVELQKKTTEWQYGVGRTLDDFKKPILETDSENRFKVWFPEAVIKRTHEAVRENSDKIHELSLTVASVGTKVDEVKTEILSPRRGL